MSQKGFFKILAAMNRALLPKMSGKDMNLANLSKWQKALVAWRYYVTIRTLN